MPLTKQLIATHMIGLIFCSAAVFPYSVSAETTEPLFNSPANQRQPAQVQNVVSADTLVLTDGTKIHMIGLKAPALPRIEKKEYDQFGFIIEKKSAHATLEDQALEFVTILLKGKDVLLEFDAQKFGPDKIVYAYVYLTANNLLANTEILRHGYATISLAPPNLRHREKLRAAYQEARREKKGIHRE